MQKIEKNQECHGNQKIPMKTKSMSKLRKIKRSSKKRNRSR
jgi:hypothetical protein